MNVLDKFFLLKKIINKKKFSKKLILSNRYNLLCIKEMINKDEKLLALLIKKNIELISAEKILIKNNPKKWKKAIEVAYKSSEMKKRIANEQNGVKQIKAGKYIF